MKNKKGWIRIVEAFVAVLLITGVLLIVVNKGYIGKKTISQKVYEDETSILREIELDDDLRKDILEAGGEMPIEWEEFDTALRGLNDVKLKIDSRTPEYLECQAKICRMDEICVLQNPPEDDVYAQTVAITANLEIYNPRQLKLFCWVK